METDGKKRVKKPFEYGRRVKVTNWHDRKLAAPIDIEHPKHSTTSHFRTFGDSDMVYMPKTTYQESMDSLQNMRSCSRVIARSEINFMSYPMNDYRFNNIDKKHYIAAQPKPARTTYQEIFKPPYAIIKKEDCCKEALDPLINRIPKNDFEMLPSSSNKFMDDHLVMLSEGRKKINRFRQMRNASNPFN